MTDTGPIRMCVSCRRRAPQASLIRLAVTDDGAVAVAQLHRRGRGAYVCPSARCLTVAVKKGAVARGLRTHGDVPNPEQIALSTATVVGSRLERIAQCPTASKQREQLSRLRDALLPPTGDPGALR